MKLCLQKLGLKVNGEEQAVPTLSRLHLSAHQAADVSNLVASWTEIITLVDGVEYVKGENDTFCLEAGGRWGFGELENALRDTAEEGSTASESKGDDNKTREIRELIEYTSASASMDGILDYDKVIKNMILHNTALPSPQDTPFFQHNAYYANLTHYHNKCENEDRVFGKFLMYGEVVTSTNTLLEKYFNLPTLSLSDIQESNISNRNPSLLRNLPQGFTLTATTQIAGRGRGSNVWVAPPGGLMFSFTLTHPLSLTSAPIIFIQYLAALAIIRGIDSYGPGYDSLPVRLKWPNDIYASSPVSQSPSDFVKIGGILVNSSFSGTSYSVVTGIGLNLDNALPTCSLNQLAAKQNLKPLTAERLLASILANFEAVYREFCKYGFSRDLEAEYYEAWLHTEQIVTLETHEGLRAKIKGITRDWGLLLAEELGWGDRGTGRVIALQSDSNSFDFFKGLVKRKV